MFEAINEMNKKTYIKTLHTTKHLTKIDNIKTLKIALNNQDTPVRFYECDFNSTMNSLIDFSNKNHYEEHFNIAESIEFLLQNNLFYNLFISSWNSSRKNLYSKIKNMISH